MSDWKVGETGYINVPTASTHGKQVEVLNSMVMIDDRRKMIVSYLDGRDRWGNQAVLADPSIIVRGKSQLKEKFVAGRI